MSRKLAWMEGGFVEAGEELAAIGNEKSKRIRVSLPQESATESAIVSSDALVYVDGDQSISTSISQIESRATRYPPHIALCATHGGSLAVTQVNDEFLLESPRLDALISLDVEQSLRLRCGQTVHVRLSGQKDFLADINGLCQQWTGVLFPRW